MAKRKTYKYGFKVDGKVVCRGFTIDLERREQEHRRRWPRGHIEQIDSPTTHEEAWNWEREQNGHRSGSAA